MRGNSMKWLYLLIVSVLLGAFAQSVLAQPVGRITGRVTDARTGDFLPGANVMLVGKTLGAASDRYGYYKIENVPPGQYVLRVSYIGYKNFETKVRVYPGRTTKQDAKLELSAVQMKGIVVQGLLEGQRKALTQQMTSANIRNVMAREEMERFPDMNTAEVLQRVPGVNIQRSLGEGRFVMIRGTEPRLTTVTVNGEKVASPEDEERYIGLDVVNADQLESIEVIKALTPDMDGDAIGGTINLVTRSAFDYEKPVLKLDLGSGYANLAKKPLARASLVYSNVFGAKSNFGVSLSANWYRNYTHSHSDEMDWNNEEDVLGNTIPFALSDSRFYNYNTHRDHLGISGSLEYRLGDHHRWFLRGMFNQRNDDQSRQMVRYRVSKGDYLNPTTVSRARLAYELQARDEIQKISSVTAGGVQSFGSLDLDYTVSYSYADETKNNPGQIKSEWQLDQKVNLNMDVSNPDFPKFSITNLDNPNYIYDPAHWEIDTQDYRETFTSNGDLLGSFNLKKPYSFGGYPAEFKAGGKIRMQKKDRNSNRWKYKWKGNEDVYMSRIADKGVVDHFLLGKYTFGPLANPDKWLDFFKQYRAKSDGLREQVVLDDPDGQGGKYNATEDIYAGYAMTKVNIGDLMVLAGVRAEMTQTSYKGFELLYDENGDFLNSRPVKNTNSYVNLFPDVHFRYRLGQRTNLRLAFTTGISRPNYFDLAPYHWVFPEDRQILEGNPDLKPTTSKNVDLLFAHYLHGIGTISSGVFYKNLNDVSYHRFYQVHGGAYDGYFVEQPVNGGKATLYGFELSWQQQFTFLPGIFSGFGIYANYTRTKSNADLKYRERNVLPGQAADVGNIGLSYEKYGLTSRLSLNYNGHFLYEVGKNPDYDRYTDDHLQLDFSANYEVLRGLNIYLQMVNLTNEPRRDYYGIPSRPRMNEYYSWWARAGVKYSF